MSDEPLVRIATAWWNVPHGDRLRVADTMRGRELAALLDRTIRGYRGDDRLCCCLMSQQGHDVQCPARRA